MSTKGIVPWLSEFFTGEASNPIGAMILVASVATPALVVSSCFLPAPEKLGGHAFTFACVVGGAIVGILIGALFTPVSKAEARRFSGLGSFLAGIGGTLLITSLKDEILANLRVALTFPEYCGPVYSAIISILLSAGVTIAARQIAADAADHELVKANNAAVAKAAADAALAQQPNGGG